MSLGYYPALVEGGTTRVRGELYEVDDDTLRALDRLEGVPNFYQRKQVWLARGGPVEGYVLPAARAAQYPIVQCGDWRRKV